MIKRPGNLLGFLNDLMYKYSFFAAVFLASLFMSCAESQTKTNQVKSALSEPNDSVLRHVVLFSFNETSSAEEISTIEKSFSALPSKIKEIDDYEWGLNNSPEGLNKGLTHCFLVTFKTEADRQAYLPHPDHKAFVDLLGPHLKDVLVVDYWTK